MALHSCDLCKSTEKLPLPGDPSGKIAICASCGFVYVPERRSVAEIAAAWDEIYKSGLYDPNWPGVKARLFYVAEWIAQNIGVEDKNLLDIGCGDGFFMDCMFKRGCYVRGLDPSLKNIAAVNERGYVAIEGFASDDTKAYGPFDFVTLNWTLENTGDCLEVLRYAERCMAPDGHLIVATGSRILVPFKKSLSAYLPPYSDYPHDTHCFRWSDNSIKRAFQAVGLGYKSGWNDYFDRDEMIAVATHDGKTIEDHDNPEAVRAHFENWRILFP